LDISTARQRNACFQSAPLEAELVPGLQHTRAVVEVVILESIETKVQGSIGRSYCIWVVPFEILRNTIPDVNTLEIGIVSIVEGSSIDVKLVREL
jgi:hypothetical protein